MFQTRACRKCGENFVAMSRAHAYCRRHRKQPQRPWRPKGCICTCAHGDRLMSSVPAPCQAAIWDAIQHRWQCGRTRYGYQGPRRGRPSRCEVCQARDATLRWYSDAQQWACATHEGSKTAEDAWAEYVEANSSAAELAESRRLATPDRVRRDHWDLPISQLVDCIEACEWVAWATEQPLQDALPTAEARRALDREGREPAGIWDQARETQLAKAIMETAANIAVPSQIITSTAVEVGGRAKQQLAMKYGGTEHPGQIVMLEPGEQVIPCDCEWDEIVTDGGHRERVLTWPCVMHSTHGNFQR